MITRYVSLVLFFLMFLSVMIPPATATKTYPTHIRVYGNDLHNGVFTVHTNDTGRKHNLKAQVHYINSKGEDKILNSWGGIWLKFDVFFECWEKPDQDNNGNGIPGELLYTERDNSYFESEIEVNPAKWHQHGVPTGEYNIKIIFKELHDDPPVGWDKIFYSSSITILFRLLP